MKLSLIRGPALDFGNQGKVMREIRALAAAGYVVLFTRHDPNHAICAAARALLPG